MISKDFLEHLLGRLKIFWTSMILVFFVVSLQYLGLHVPNMVPFITTKIQSIFHPIQGALPIPEENTQAVRNTKGGE